ncbi:hypothetical protein [Stutzerimonas xanthomarina]|uniref:hypothetical protein n=1 Tax=Stutzerimonas xanthomarina TaxID=271420 RepID=UPI003AA9C37C
MSQHVVEGEASDEFSINLPLKKRELGSFITSLLGQQQSIDRALAVDFDIDHAWLVNLHELLNQRICQQAAASLVDFVANVYFEGGLKRTITSIEAFKGYVETKNELSVGVTLHWNYLIQFPGKSYPEKQEITFVARVKPDKKSAGHEIGFFSSLVVQVVSETENRFIGYEISHTERTWGDDVDGLIANQLNKVVRREGGLTAALYTCFRWGLAFGMFILLAIYPLYLATNSSETTIATLYAEYQAIPVEPASLETVTAKLDVIANILNRNAERAKGVYSFALTFLAPFAMFLILKFTRKTAYSFIVLNAIDEARRTNMLAKENRSLFVMVGAYFFAILAGVAGNYVFKILNELPTL